MSVIPFPVCEYAANHCREGRRLGNISNYIEGRRLKINPIPYGISIPTVLRGGVKFTPPAKNIFRSVIFPFFYTYHESYVQLA